jgi:hypothetical protein
MQNKHTKNIGFIDHRKTKKLGYISTQKLQKELSARDSSVAIIEVKT